MIKTVLFFAVVLLVVACGPSVKMFPEERFLSLRPGEDQIFFISAVPTDSSGTYMSTFIFSRSGGGASATIDRYTPGTERRTRRNYVAPQGIRSYDDTTYMPVYVNTDTLNPTSHHFQLTLDRKVFRFTKAWGSGTYNYSVRYGLQEPFLTQLPRTDWRIGGLEPIEGDLRRIYDDKDHLMNGEKIKKPCLFFYHTLETIDLLSAEKTYYWIDFSRFGETGYSVLFERDAAGVSKVLYSTLPAGEQLDAQLFHTTDNSGILLIGLNSMISDEKLTIAPMDNKPVATRPKEYTAKTVTITENNRKVGSGVLYQF